QRPRFVTGTTPQWPIGLLDPTRPPLPPPRPTIPPKATSRDPAARRRTRALWGLCPELPGDRPEALLAPLHQPYRLRLELRRERSPLPPPLLSHDTLLSHFRA